MNTSNDATPINLSPITFKLKSTAKRNSSSKWFRIKTTETTNKVETRKIKRLMKPNAKAGDAMGEMSRDKSGRSTVDWCLTWTKAVTDNKDFS